MKKIRIAPLRTFASKHEIPSNVDEKKIEGRKASWVDNEGYNKSGKELLKEEVGELKDKVKSSASKIKDATVSAAVEGTKKMKEIATKAKDALKGTASAVDPKDEKK